MDSNNEGYSNKKGEEKCVQTDKMECLEYEKKEEKFEQESTSTIPKPTEAKRDAIALRKAMKGFWTNEKHIIDIVTNRNDVQRREIADVYKAIFLRDLISDLQLNSSINYSETIQTLRTKFSNVIGEGTKETAKETENPMDEEKERKLRRISQIYSIFPFDASEDAAILRRAIKGYGNDEAAIINIVTNRNHDQRLQIVAAYKTLYSSDLVKDLKGDSNGSYLNTILDLMTKSNDINEVEQEIEEDDDDNSKEDEFEATSITRNSNYFNAKADATVLRKVMMGIGTDERAIIDVVAERNDDQRQEIVQTYKTLFSRDLINDFKTNLCGTFLRAILLLMSSENHKNEDGNNQTLGTSAVHSDITNDANEDAAVLRQAMKSLAADEEAIIDVVIKRNGTQRQEIVRAYKVLYSRNLIEDFQDDLRGSVLDIIIALMGPSSDEVDEDSHVYEDIEFNPIMCSTLKEVNVEESQSEKSNQPKGTSESGVEIEKQTQENKKDREEKFENDEVPSANISGFHSHTTAVRADALLIAKAALTAEAADSSEYVEKTKNNENTIIITKSIDDAHTGTQRKTTIVECKTKEYHEFKDTTPIHSDIPFDANKDAAVLRKAMEGFGTDEEAIFYVVTKRNDVQRQEIARAYKDLYSRDLIEDFKGDVSGSLLKKILALMNPSSDKVVDKNEINENKDREHHIAIRTESSDNVQAEKPEKTPLVVGGILKDDEFTSISVKRSGGFFHANMDAGILRIALKSSMVDEHTITAILTDRNDAQRPEIIKAYKALYSNEFISDLKSKSTERFSNEIIRLLNESSVDINEQSQGNEEKGKIETQSMVTSTAHPDNFSKWDQQQEDMKGKRRKTAIGIQTKFTPNSDVVSTWEKRQEINGQPETVKCFQKPEKVQSSINSNFISQWEKRCEMNKTISIGKTGNGTKLKFTPSFRENFISTWNERKKENNQNEEGNTEIETRSRRFSEIHSVNVFYPYVDAAVLRNALTKDVADENAITKILTERNYAQRVEIIKAYRDSYARDFINDLQQKSNEDFSKKINALMTESGVDINKRTRERTLFFEEKAQIVTQPDYTTPVHSGIPVDANKDAAVIKKTVEGELVDEDTVKDIIINRTDKQRQEIVIAYKTLYSKDLIKELEENFYDTSLHTIIPLMSPPSDEVVAKNKDKAKKNRELHLVIRTEPSNNADTGKEEMIEITEYKIEIADKSKVPSANISGFHFPTPEVRPDAFLTAKAALAAEAADSSEDVEKTKNNEDTIIITESIECKTIEYHEFKDTTPIYSDIPFDANKDAAVLRKAMKGFGTDEEAILNVVTKRNDAQRQEIARAYKDLYSRDLIEDFKGDLSGSLLKKILALMTQSSDEVVEKNEMNENKDREHHSVIGTESSVDVQAEKQEKITIVVGETVKDNELTYTTPIYSDISFDANKDAAVLRKAMKGFGTDEEAILNVVTKRNDAQRQEIARAYKDLYSRDLIEDFKEDLSGSLLKKVLALMTPSSDEVVDKHEINENKDEEHHFVIGTESSVDVQAEKQEKTTIALSETVKDNESTDTTPIHSDIPFDANKDAAVLRKAMKGFGTDEEAILNIITKRNDVQRQEIARAYKDLYSRDLIKDFCGDLSGSLLKKILALMTPSSDENNENKDKEFIHNVQTEKQEKITIAVGETVKGKELTDTTPIYSDNSVDAYKDATVLRKAMKGFGTDEEAIISIMTKRNDVQRQEISRAYKKLYSRDLIEDFRGDLSGSLLKEILALMTPSSEEVVDKNENKDKESSHTVQTEKQERTTIVETVKDNESTHTTPIHSDNSFDAYKDAAVLRKAMKGFGTDEEAIISIMTKRNDFQRQEIARAYKELYSRDLIEDFKGDLSGIFLDVILGLMSQSSEDAVKHEDNENKDKEHKPSSSISTTRSEIPFDANMDAVILRNAITSCVVDEKAITDVFTQRNSAQQLEIIKAYQVLYSNEFIKDLKSKSSENISKTIIDLTTEFSGTDKQIQGNEKNGEEKAEIDTQSKVSLTNHSDVVSTIDNRTQVNNVKIEEKTEMDTQSKDTAIIHTSINFNANEDAAVLRKAMKGFGTDENAIINIVTQRNHVERREIVKAYKKLHSRDLISDFRGDLSGSFLEIILALMIEASDVVVGQRLDYENKNHNKSMTMTKIHNSFAAKKDAVILRLAISGSESEEKEVVNVMTKRNAAQRLEIAAVYKNMYSRDLISDLKAESDRNFSKTILALMIEDQNEEASNAESSWNLAKPGVLFDANEDALILKKALKGLEIDDKAIIKVMTKRDHAQRREIARAYNALYSKDLISDILEELSGDFLDTVLALMVDPSENVTKDIRELKKNEERKKKERKVEEQVKKKKVEQEKKKKEERKRKEGKDDQSTGPSVLYTEHLFDAQKEATLLRKAMKGLGTDEKVIFEVLTKRNYIQRSKIAESYKLIYARNLVTDLKNDLSGKFLQTIIALMTEPADFMAKELEDAKDEITIVEILCSMRNNINLARIIENDKKSVEQYLKIDLESQFKLLLISLTNADFEETSDSCSDGANKAARALHKAEMDKKGAFEHYFNTLLVSCNYLQLQHIFKEYEQIAGCDIQLTIEKIFSGSLKKGFLGIVRFIKSKDAFFAQRIHEEAINKSETKDRTLIRIIVSRSEIDLEDIKKTFEKIYGKTLEAFVKAETSKDYKNTLLSIIAHSTSSNKSTLAS